MTTTATQQKEKIELAKFFSLTIKLGRKLEMFSDYLDEYWHEMMKDENAYNTFCIDACGSQIEHIDSSVPGASGHGPISWIKEYEKDYGKLPKEWFMDAAGNIDDTLYESYVQTGEVVAAWKCNPKGNSGGKPKK